MHTNEYNDGISVVVADASHEKYVDTILQTITDAAKVRGSGIASRTHEYLATKMKERKAIIALYGEEFAGFCYIESWENKQYVANSGLIVVPKFRGHHLATRIKRLAFSLSRVRWPKAKIFGLTSSGAVMRASALLGIDTRRRILERLRYTRRSLLHQLRRLGSYRKKILRLHRYAVRSRTSSWRPIASRSATRCSGLCEKGRGFGITFLTFRLFWALRVLRLKSFQQYPQLLK